MVNIVIKKVIKLIFVVLWMSLIFIFSNDSGVQSTKKSDGFIIRIVEVFYGRELSLQEKEKWVAYLVLPVRKGAHLGVYLILGVLALSFISEFISISWKSILISMVVCFIYACSDEVHQLLVPGRSGNIKDVLLDTIGSGIGVLGLNYILRRMSKNEQKERVS